MSPIWNVPFLANPNFTGRKALITALHDALSSGQPAALTQTLSGLGGVGKTQLAVEYAYRHRDDYRVIWWVQAEDRATLAADYAALATELGLPERDASEQEVVVNAVRRWLEQHGKWLLIFDNVTAPGEVQPYLPRAASGHVLITSRSQVWGGLAQRLTVAVFERLESVAFLSQRTQQGDTAAADVLAEALGDLPLALAQAASYIESTGTPMATYLELFETRRADHVNRGLGGGPVKGMAQRFTVHRDEVAPREIAQGTTPRDETPGQFLRVQPRQDPPERVMTGNAMRQLQHLSEPLGLGLAILLDVFPALRSTNHRTDRDDENVNQLVALIRGIRGPGIG